MNAPSAVGLALALGLASLVAACASTGGADQASPTPPFSAPSPAPVASSAVSSASASADPAAEAGRAYLRALVAYLAAIEAATDACGGRTVAVLQRCFGDSAKALGTFRSKVGAISFPTDLQARVGAMLGQADELRVLLSGAAGEPSLERIETYWWPRIDEIDVAVLEAAQELRKAMGLPAADTD